MAIHRLRTVHAEQITELPDGRLKKGTRELSRPDSDRLREIIGDDDGTVPEHIGVESLADGQEIIWRIEDGERAGKTWAPSAGDDADARKADAQIAEYLKPYVYDPAPEEWRLRERGVPVWAIIGSLTAGHENADDVARSYRVSPEAVYAARLYYFRHQAAIDARLAANRAP
ncbi:MAG: hypothetical protein ACYDAR_14960 [Thermomicrobiales bacterium]